VNSGSPEL